jgi:hypothetical protein
MLRPRRLLDESAASLAVAARVPLVRAALEYTTLTRLYHRYREPGTRLRDVSRKAKLAPAEKEI